MSGLPVGVEEKVFSVLNMFKSRSLAKDEDCQMQVPWGAPKWVLCLAEKDISQRRRPLAILSSISLLAVILFGSVLTLNNNLRNTRFSANTLNWANTSCQIVESNWEDLGYKNKGAERVWRVEYRYTVDGKQYLGTTSKLSTLSGTYISSLTPQQVFEESSLDQFSKDDEKRLSMTHTRGAEVECFYNQEFPQMSVLIRYPIVNQIADAAERNYSTMLFASILFDIAIACACYLSIMKHFGRVDNEYQADRSV